MARFVSTKNPLLATGAPNSGDTWSDALTPSAQEDSVVGLVKTDQAGTLHVEQSLDNANWDVDDTVTVVANTGQRFSFPVVAPYIRVRFVNTSASPQTFLRLAARFSSAGPR